MRAILILLCFTLSATTAALMACAAYCYRADNPRSYEGYMPGTPRYEAREIWLGLNDILTGRSTTLDVDWSAFNPFEEESNATP